MTDDLATATAPQFELHAGPYTAGELDVRALRGREEISHPFHFEVIVATTLDADTLDHELLGAFARLTIHTRDHGARVVDGIITEVRAQSDLLPGARHRCRVRLEPRLSLAALRRDTRIFQDLTVTEIVDAVLRDHRVECEWRLDGRYPPRTYCVQHDESDLEFVHRLLAEEGIFYVFAPPSEHGATGRERIVCLDSAEGYIALDGVASLAWQPAEGMVEDAEHVHRFKLTRRVRTGSVTLHDYDFERPSLDLTSRERLAEPARRIDERALEVYEHHGEHHDPDVRRSLARAKLDGLRADALVGVGRSGCRRLAPGRTFTLTDHELAKLNQRYAVTRVTHEGHRGEQRASGRDDGRATKPTYVNRFECVPAAVAFRAVSPPRHRAQVVETATVVGPAGEEIYTDPLGRIKVQFHWDRHGQRNERSSCWIRVAQTWAGAGWGFQFVPRIGMEVLVTFLGGDLDRPMVTGCVFNGEHPLPYALPEHKSRSGIRTSSTPGGDGSNELRFEDAKGREQVYLHAQRDLDAVTENNRSDVVHGHETRTVDRNRSRTVRGHETVAVGHSQRISVDGDHVRTVKGNEVVTIHKNLVMHVVGRQVIHIDGRDPDDGDEGEDLTPPAPVAPEAAKDALDSTRLPSSEVLAQMIAMPRVAEALSTLATEPRVAEALGALASQTRLVEVLSTVAGDPRAADALASLGGKTTAAVLLRARSLAKDPAVDAAKLVADLRPETQEIPEGLDDAVEAATGGGGVERGGGGGRNAFTLDPKDRNRSVMSILGRGEIESPDGFKISAGGGSYIEVTAAGITLHGPVVTIEGHPIKLNC